MTDKYYTPTIEEFCWDFEYEIEWSTRWKKFKVDQWFNFQGPIIDDKIRVKYLDREDIESLGFKQDHNHNDVRFGYTNGSTRIQHTPHRNNIEIYQWGHESDTVSGITIKNKSELKRLLKQLNI